MRSVRYAPLAVIASFGLAFTSACGEEKTTAEGALASAPHAGGQSGVQEGSTGITVYLKRPEAA
jgi:hypothetical protein